MNVKYSGPSKVEHSPFQEAVRLSICSTFELKWHEPHGAVQSRAHDSTFEFLFEFQTEFFSIFFFRNSSCSRIKPFDVRGSTVFSPVTYRYYCRDRTEISGF
jgi:hypothetical protein